MLNGDVLMLAGASLLVIIPHPQAALALGLAVVCALLLIACLPGESAWKRRMAPSDARAAHIGHGAGTGAPGKSALDTFDIGRYLLFTDSTSSSSSSSSSSSEGSSGTTSRSS